MNDDISASKGYIVRCFDEQKIYVFLSRSDATDFFDYCMSDTRKKHGPYIHNTDTLIFPMTQ
jgi:hypothetical protein